MIRTREEDAPPFPFSGSIAFVGGTAEKVKILQDRRDGTLLVKREGYLSKFEGASQNRAEPLANLYPTADEAIRFKADGKRKPTRRRKAA